MKVFVDSSIFLVLILNENGADEAQEILEGVELGKILGYVTPLVLEEVSFKIVYAEASHQLETTNIWEIRERLKKDDRLRSRCFKSLRKFVEYVEFMLTRGLRVEEVLYVDWLKSLEFVERYGLLPADALHVAVASRLNIDTIATFDEDFKKLEGFKIIPA